MQKSQSKSFKLMLLSLSLMLMIAPNIAAAIPLMAKTFGNQSASAVETLSTIPNLGIIFGIFCGAPLNLRIGAKRTILVGLAIAFITGVLPVFITNYPIILIARLLLGFGIGLFNSLAISLISHYYRGDELATMMGFQSAFQSLGSSVMSFAVSYLIIFGWHATFLIYAIALPIFIAFLIGMTNENTAKTATQPKVTHHQRLNLSVILISVLTLALYVFFMVVTVQLATLVTTKNLGTAAQASAVLGGFTLVSMLVGLGYGKVYQQLTHWVLPLGLVIMAAGFLGVSQGATLMMVTLATMIIGVGFAITIPYIYTLVNTQAPTGSENLASSVMLVMTNIGVFISPTVVNALAKLTGLTGVTGTMSICAIGLLILSLLTLASTYWQHQHTAVALKK
ncbi:MFS transporter [Lactiplantibacillus mudanjiangensis]|uniref:Major facilitator superfamily (MFS) profile domain-containing protein n=1 Tax=Lactiplantibacillus mudanjiangensis TaxID=1296538 RepID=A0A660DZV9_9LACO|nr:MFS transporter [Lactiplantibacillus mudanjiangensis]VDG19547.1 hypothetical protein [Lactobacillus paracollinoides] [Lactiplantibacillus mudanjiangensis]VDG23378.1 hypothetical protein [Lactobacillus paracollinoides] [Lactiplantibacillus mudanjiangensis]VDG28740.1 hypothetical protein [Lactobacillus paracollinoides] [Lactiplantibacillus mudanjiangensis]VDG30996.1 hypothetical protein [Lactobacillus paracollinoides] [Lactiplantibacillus mudanjiangensis]